jgi:hypothetical protein
VSLRVDYDERAIDQATAFLDDPPGIRASRATDRHRPAMHLRCTCLLPHVDLRRCRVEASTRDHTDASDSGAARAGSGRSRRRV